MGSTFIREMKVGNSSFSAFPPLTRLEDHNVLGALDDSEALVAPNTRSADKASGAYCDLCIKI